MAQQLGNPILYPYTANFFVINPKSGEKVRAWHMFNRVKLGEEHLYHKPYLMKGECVYLAGARLKNSDRLPELKILICFNRSEEAVATHKERWLIETLFKTMTSAGFNIEDTHMREMHGSKGSLPWGA